MLLRWVLVALITVMVCHPAGDPWRTPAGAAAKAEIQSLKNLGVFDDLKEYHDELTEALREGCVNFMPWPSRIECPGMKKPTPERCAVAANVKLLYRVMPVAIDPASERGFTRWTERGRNRITIKLR